ncbi:transglutaminase-like domain-containing protein [Streptomyces sp. NBC_00344]|uniref:transglutaminase-like domain-containing protein n=1 Tax=Streptomyces sp. NBC_00344 TaxID=2975720 RepID=UPI002E24685D
MELVQEVPDLSAYLAADDVIDHGHPVVQRESARLRRGAVGAYAYAQAAYEFVRDGIPHSADSGDPGVTWRASDVIEQRTGICYAKSHALAALLRAGSIPAALCYQRLADDDGSHHAIHGLVAVRLPGRNTWDRQDARGNVPGVNAQFALDGERLAWAVRAERGEVDYPLLFAAPHPVVLSALKQAPDRSHLQRTLPSGL